MGKPLSSLSLRLISSAILIPVVVGILFAGGWVYGGFVTLIIIIAFYEWVNITKHIPMSSIKKTGLSLIGFLYLGFSLFEIVLLRNEIFFQHLNYYMPFTDGDGIWYTILFLLAVWSSDSGAYLFGKTIGGKKMSPTISPNKTWSGYTGALLFPALILMLEQTTHPHWEFDSMHSTLPVAALFGVMIGIAGQSGDLMISAMKRKAGLKDTGAIIPGHGGILDRIDALLLALPVFLAYIKFASE